MKYIVLASCLFLVGFSVVGCGSSDPTNVVTDANQAALDEYEKALADADRMAAGDKDFKD